MSEPVKPRFRRVVARPARRIEPGLDQDGLAHGASGSSADSRFSGLWHTIKSYLGLGNAAKLERIAEPEGLARFLASRASYVAQTSLYGYLRTRAGMRYPELFDDDPFVESINIAKWHVWIDCLSDLALHAGGCLARQSPSDAWRIGPMMRAMLEGIVGEAGMPAEAGTQFPAHVEQVLGRVAQADWLAVSQGSDESAFTESPSGLVRWAPVLDELKQLDEEIVRNSVRFRWQEVRRDLATHLDAKAVLAAAFGAR